MFRRKLVQWPNNALLGAFPSNPVSGSNVFIDLDFVNGVYLGGTIPEGSNGGTLLRQQIVNVNPSFMENVDGSLKTFTATSSVRRTDKGLMSDGNSRACQIIQNRDLTNVAWTKTNCTALKNQTGRTGVANSASQLTMTADAGTCLQSVTISASTFYGYIEAKRISGTGTLSFTIDGTNFTVLDLSAPIFNSWAVGAVGATTPGAGTFNMGFRGSTNGDVWAIDFVNVNPQPLEMSPIATVAAKVTGTFDRPSAYDSFNSPLQTYFASTSVRCVYAEFAFRTAGGIITASTGTLLNVRSTDCQAFSAAVTTGNAPTLATSPRLTQLNKVMAWQTPSQTGICLNGGTIVTASGAAPNGGNDHWDLLTNGSSSASIDGRCTRMIFFNAVPSASLIQSITT